MKDTKYQALEDTESVSPSLPPYELNHIEADASSPAAPEEAAAPEEPSLTITDHIVKLFSSIDFSKSYSFKVKSMVYDQRTFRFKYPPKNGFERLRKLIRDKIHYNLNQETGSENLAIGYVDAHNDLIMILGDEDLLECVNNSEKTHPCKGRMSLIVYDSDDHLRLSRQIKRRKTAIEVTSITVGLSLAALLLWRIF